MLTKSLNNIESSSLGKKRTVMKTTNIGNALFCFIFWIFYNAEYLKNRPCIIDNLESVQTRNSLTIHQDQVIFSIIAIKH